MFCRICGARLEEGAKFCHKCGRAVSNGGSAGENAEAVNEGGSRDGYSAGGNFGQNGQYGYNNGGQPVYANEQSMMKRRGVRPAVIVAIVLAVLIFAAAILLGVFFYRKLSDFGMFGYRGDNYEWDTPYGEYEYPEGGFHGEFHSGTDPYSYWGDSDEDYSGYAMI